MSYDHLMTQLTDCIRAQWLAGMKGDVAEYRYFTEKVRNLTTQLDQRAKGRIYTRARVLLEAWLRGTTQGGHPPIPEEIVDAYKAAVVTVRGEIERVR